jgi:hypothetical protein
MIREVRENEPLLAEELRVEKPECAETVRFGSIR